ncbi:hypothetical protein [Aromatoleum bremense]|uniref:Uncharacterized protein n=1 Tax=Aromatoleum bremense TaxID=76115 RepID=A0ABX1NXJ6_9RHOO|nr:hypothetical protein [Aromatoleum bremense]NMG16749.1 hypothetical protein [Aromatoleum bremense]QTQ33019.1 Uncharacterized protein pbN1_30310 [Aromatoleum bremense]
MALHGNYKEIIVESFRPASTGGKHGPVHVRPIPGQPFPPSLFVECADRLKREYPVGTRFKIRVKLTDKEGGGQYLYSYFGWPVEVLK